MKEKISKSVDKPEREKYELGSKVPILEHMCLDSLGLFGRVTQINDEGVPVTAKCINCHKSVAVDLQALKK